MGQDTVYTKTAKGVLETRDKHTRLPREVRLVFVSIDGKTTVGELEAKSGIAPAKLHEALEKLAADGYIKSVSGSAETSSANDDDLDFTTPEGLASLNAEAATRSLAEADANARARDERRAALDAKLRQEAEARARALAELRARTEAGAREQAEAAASAARQDRIKAEQDLEAAPDPETRAEAEARLRMAAAAIARAQAEARVRADAEGRARLMAEQKRTAEEQAREEAEVRAQAENAALAQAAAQAKARAALEAQIRNIQTGAPPVEHPAVQSETPQAPAQPAPPLPLIDPFELQQQEARLRLAEEADRREQTASPDLELSDQPSAPDPRAEALQALVHSERRAREETQAKAQGDRALGAHADTPQKMPDVDFELIPAKHVEALRPTPAVSPGGDTPSPGLMRAVAQAAALVKASEGGPELEKEEGAPPKEERLNVDRAAHDMMAEQVAVRARERTQAVNKARMAERQRRQQEEARRAAVFERIRRRKQLVRGSAITLVVLLAVSTAFLQFVSLTPFIPGVEQEISARLKEPVSIGSLRYPLIPKPRVLLENVVIARGAIKADELAVPGLAFGASVYAQVEGRGITVDPVALRALPAWATTPNPAGVRLQRLSVTDVKITPLPVDVGAFNAEVEFAPNGTVTTAVLKNASAALTLKPLQEQVRFSLTGENWQLPFGPPVQFAYMDLNGTADRTQLLVNDIQGRIAGGTVGGTVQVRFGPTISAEGTLRTENVRLQEVMPAFTQLMPVAGLLKSSGRYALQSNKVETLFEAPQVDAIFSIARGEFKSIDLVRTVQASTGKTFRGGRTPFDDLSGSLRVAGGRHSYRQLSLTSGALNASGAADVAANGELSGQFNAEVGAKGRVVARSSVTLSGTLKDPAIRQ